MKYFVTVGERTLVIEINGEAVQVDGEPISVSLESNDRSPEVRLLVNDRASRLAVEGHREGVWRLVDQGAVREVTVEDERSRHVRTLAGAGKASSAGAVVKAPMPGMVVRIPVSPGDLVAVGGALLVLEAMKMENELKSPIAGVVTEVRVTVGQAVEKGQILIELGPVA
jgi:biotin carboxyl carrier protein